MPGRRTTQIEFVLLGYRTLEQHCLFAAKDITAASFEIWRDAVVRPGYNMFVEHDPSKITRFNVDVVGINPAYSRGSSWPDAFEHLFEDWQPEPHYGGMLLPGNHELEEPG